MGEEYLAHRGLAYRRLLTLDPWVDSPPKHLFNQALAARVRLFVTQHFTSPEMEYGNVTKESQREEIK